LSTHIESAGTGPGERRLNGPQTTGREYRNLSEPTYRMATDEDVEVRLRDGARLFLDVHRPDDQGRFPTLIAASPYPRESRTSVRHWVSSNPGRATSSFPAAMRT
jgi:predicted acyl esterase